MRRRWWSRIVILALASGLIAPALADVEYETRIAGVEDSDLKDLLHDASQLKLLEDRPPVSEEALRARAEHDVEGLTDAAHSLGYWDAQVSYEIDTAASPARVTVTVSEGELYHVASIDVLGPDGKHLDLAALRDPKLPMKPGDPARTAPVIATEEALLAQLGHDGYPFAKTGERTVVIDHAAHTMSVAYRLEPGPAMLFDSATLPALERLNPRYVEHRIRWQPGQPYDNRKVAETRDAIARSNLFSTVTITPEHIPGDPDHVRMKIDATERAHRTVGAGLAYNTSEGAGARVFWENRNLFGNAEYLKLSLAGGQQKTGFSTDFRRPDTLAIDQDLLANAEIAEETPAAYHSRRARVSLGLERRFGGGLVGGVSLSGERANVVEEAITSATTASGRTQHYSLVGLPMYARLDRTDDLLNPTTGFRAQATLTPYRSFSGPDLNFISGRVAGSIYRQFGDSDRYVFAGFAALSSIVGASLAALPADKRIYAGGGGSLRPYGYQLAGMLDRNNNPIGGKSALELNLEFRIKVTDTIGIVPFVDAGSYYESSLPQLGHRLLWGPGIGVRYYTAFGPVRLDVATPGQRRNGDSPIQVYISLGQAF
jgi:translocation and assembly module TamA